MAVAVAGSPTAAGATGPVNVVTIAKPTGVSDGDLLVAVLRSSSSGATAAFALAGWTRATLFTASSATSRVHGIYTKPIPSASAETATSYAFTFTGTTGRVSGQIFRVTGADLSSPVQVATAGYDSTGITNGARMGALTATGAGLLIVAGSNETTSPNSTTPATPSGTTFIGVSESTTGTGSTRSTTAAYYKAITASGTTGTFDVVWAAQSSSNAEGIIINPASATPPTAAFTHTEADLTTSVDGTGSTASSPATVSSYDWDWGDSTPHGTGSTATHTYRDAGTYTISLVVTDSAALSSTAVTHTATVTRPPRIRLGSTVELSRMKFGVREPVAIYLGSTKVRQLSHTIEEIQADTNIFVAHRGFSQTFPQSTMYAYDQAFAWGAKAIEISVWPSSSGTFWCSHDQNLLATTGHNVDITATSDATLATYSVLGSTAGDNPGQSNQPMTKLQDVLDKYGTRMVIFIEDKTYSHASTLVPILAAVPDYTHRIVWKQDANGNPMGTATAAGLKTWGYLFDSEMSFFAGQQSKFDFFGLDYNSSDSLLTSSVATCGGSRVIGHIIPSAAQVTRMLGFGMKGLMCATRAAAPSNPVL